MAEAVLMPKAGITVESCIISKWEKKIGDIIKTGDVLFSYETDKASFECESTASGELLEIYFQDGEEVPCLVNVCAIGQKGDDCSALRPGSSAPAVVPPAEPGTTPSPAVPPAAPSPPSAVGPASGGAPISPRARKLAECAGVDPALAVPTGPDGRVIERDVRRLMEQEIPAAKSAPVPAPCPAPAPARGPESEYEDVPLPGIRKVISRSMTTSLQTMAQLTENFTFDASAIQAYRLLLKQTEEFSGITLGDMLLFAVSRILPSFPDLNAHMLEGDTLRRFRHVNLGVAVDTPRGLMVPTIFHADEKSLLEISREVKDLAGQARTGKISPDLLTGASFTVTNLGSTGVVSFTPIINPPQTAILGVCGITQQVRPAPDGSPAFYPAMGLSLTVDHRAVDGAPAGRFMQKLCAQLEQFTALLAR